MAIEYMYWCIVSHMGILEDPQTCSGIDNEWELCTPELFASTDIMMHNLITDPIHKIPQLAPDGNYCPFTGLLGDLNQDGVLDILDVVSMVNVILGNDPPNNAADMNSDGIVNILDVIALVNSIFLP